MFRHRSVFFVMLMLMSVQNATAETHVITSPDQRISLQVRNDQGQMSYQVTYQQNILIDWSALGFTFKNQPDWQNGVMLVADEKSEHDSNWEQVWGEQRLVRDHYQSLTLTAKEINSPWRAVRLYFRAYDDGIALRYEIPEQPSVDEFVVMDELTEYQFTDDHAIWWIPGLTYDRYELLYRRTPISQVKVAHTPATLVTKSGVHVAIHEANLGDYTTMTLTGGNGSTLKTKLVPWKNGDAVRATAPMLTPWRTIQIADSAAKLLESNLILNLNEPNQLIDTDWIKPQKFIGIWWGMHLRTMTWGSGPIHGATTTRTKEYIDYAAELKIPAVLVEGWNLGWDGDWEHNGGRGFSFTKPYPDFDIVALASYAASKGVDLIGHHETAGGISNYEAQADDAFALYRRLGIRTVKTGYVGDTVEGGEWHHGQFMVRHHQKIAELAAIHGIMLDIHEPIKDTGLRRTYPNVMTREGARGIEYDAWDPGGGNPPEHHTVIPFTRGLSGPFDVTPGIFDLLASSNPAHIRTRTTLAKQLALYVTVYSPLHMAADLPENYLNHPAFKFIQDVPTDWETTKGINGAIGDYITVARKDRHSNDWYLGATTDENARELEVKLDFLEEGQYRAEIYRDHPDSDYDTRPLLYEITDQIVNCNMTLKLQLAAGGGQAIRFVKLN